MKSFISLLSVVSFIVLQQQILVSGQDVECTDRKWFESNGTLYRIEVEAQTKWKKALTQCKFQKMSLMNMQPGRNTQALHDFANKIYREYPSFWVQHNVTYTTLMQKIGFKMAKGGRGQKCNKLDHKTFVVQSEKCDKLLGFICERQLKTGHSIHQIHRQQYYIEPQKQYSCPEAKQTCAKQNMTLVLSTSFIRNTLLKDYIFLNYGSSPTFWFVQSNTSDECFPLGRLDRLTDGLQHGFICERTIVRAALTLRHWVLIGVVSVAAFLSIIVFMACKCYLHRKSEEIQISSPMEKKLTFPQFGDIYVK